tara:strand:+ start:2569 stop:3345 length:777 start_codon:yes stop_codon:yes gene_type:complete
VGGLDVTACLYRARVTHRRPGPPAYRFAYRTYHLLIDLDAIDATLAASSLISRNRFNLLSFYDADHGSHDGADLRHWVDGVLAEHDIDLAGGRVWLLAMPRVLGYGFNPISLYYCFSSDGSLVAVLAEVHNTFGEHHVYVVHDNGAAMAWQQAMDKTKRFHVSPFFDRSGRYRFHFLAPEHRLGLGIRLYDEAGCLRIATALAGHRRPLTSGQILRAALAVPWMSAKVSAAIHWQAAKLWLRGAVFHRKPVAERPNRS